MQAELRPVKSLPAAFIVSDLPVPDRAWKVLGIGSSVLLVGSLLARQHYTAIVRLTPDRSVLAATVLASVGLVTLGIALIGRRSETVGLIGLSAVSFGLGAAWLMLGDHKFDGPVVISVSSSHGVHAGDLFAILPLGVGAMLLARGLWSARRRMAMSVTS